MQYAVGNNKVFFCSASVPWLVNLSCTCSQEEDQAIALYSVKVSQCVIIYNFICWFKAGENGCFYIPSHTENSFIQQIIAFDKGELLFGCSVAAMQKIVRFVFGH